MFLRAENSHLMDDHTTCIHSALRSLQPVAKHRVRSGDQSALSGTKQLHDAKRQGIKTQFVVGNGSVELALDGVPDQHHCEKIDRANYP